MLWKRLVYGDREIQSSIGTWGRPMHDGVGALEGSIISRSTSKSIREPLMITRHDKLWRTSDPAPGGGGKGSDRSKKSVA